MKTTFFLCYIHGIIIAPKWIWEWEGKESQSRPLFAYAPQVLFYSSSVFLSFFLSLFSVIIFAVIYNLYMFN